MNIRTLIALVAGTAVSILLGWFIAERLLTSFYSTHIVYYPGLLKVESVHWAKALAHACLVLLIIYVLSHGDSRTLLGGLIVGFTVGLLVSASYDLFFYAGWNMFSKRALAINIVTNIIVSSITGAVVGAIMKE